MSIDCTKIIGSQKKWVDFYRKSDGATKQNLDGCNSDKKLIFGKKKLPPLSSQNPSNSSLMPVRFWEVIKKVEEK